MPSSLWTERVPVGRFINPVRGFVIGLLAMALLGLGLGLLMILQPDAPTPATGYLLEVLQPSPGAVLPGWERTFTVEFTLGRPETAHPCRTRTSLGSPYMSDAAAHRRRGRHVDALQLPRRHEDVPMPRRDTPVSAGGIETYVTVFEGPNRFMEGRPRRRADGRRVGLEPVRRAVQVTSASSRASMRR